MDSAADSEVGPPVVGEKRPLENGETEELGVRSVKKANTGNAEMRRVAEIVLVLSTMAGIRAGRNPTETELNLMTEARAKLVHICQDLPPTDLVARDAIGTLIDDLGLNWKLKDQRLGYRGSRLSIKDKFALSKMKMEESRKHNAASAYTPQLSQPSYGATAEVRGPSHSIRMYQSDKLGNPSLPSGGLPSSLAPGHVSAAATPQLLKADVRASTVPIGISNSHPVIASGVDKTHFKLGGGSNGTNYVPQVQANASGHQPVVNAPTWSLQSHSMSSIKTSPENKINYNVGKPEGVIDLGVSRAPPQAAPDQTFRPFIAQSTSTNLPSGHQPMQGVKYVQTSPVFNHHIEIAKIVQKLLQPKVPQHPPWTPPSREYMYKPLTCQMCHAMMSEVETVVVCDACEKGFHSKCLETLNQKGIPRGGEWHCIRCTTLSNGKPLPPKYGRVMRSSTPLKGHFNSPGALPSLEKKSEVVDQKVNQDILLTANGSSVVQDPAVPGIASSSAAEPESDMKVLNGRGIIENSMTPAVKGMDEGSSSERVLDNSIKSLDAISDLPNVGLSVESSNQLSQVSESQIREDIPVSESNMQPPVILSEMTSDKLEKAKPSKNLQDSGETELSNACEVPSTMDQDNCKNEASENKGHSDLAQDIGQPEVSNACEIPLSTNHDNYKDEGPENKKEQIDMATASDVRKSEHDITHPNAVGSSEANEQATEHIGKSSDGLHSVKWVGNALKVVDGITFYDSCLINGITYKVQDHALFCSGNEKFMPSKLQAMWEDIGNGSKWVTATQCYFPGDLPEAVGHPCAPEINEVYESNHENRTMAGLIQGPCEVLPPTKFQENRERQRQLGIEGNKESQPVFLCKWFYDESKGNFQPVIG
ncbi:RING/FYVE/PHD zinc finger superfamily protein [Euphorbia peplus]|nr:RING/FYVE/PHD zinc finger superfamily protein [Euphorbia peplus]